MTPAGCEEPVPVTRCAPKALPTARPACIARYPRGRRRCRRGARRSLDGDGVLVGTEGALRERRVGLGDGRVLRDERGGRVAGRHGQLKFSPESVLRTVEMPATVAVSMRCAHRNPANDVGTVLPPAVAVPPWRGHGAPRGRGGPRRRGSRRAPTCARRSPCRGRSRRRAARGDRVERGVHVARALLGGPRAFTRSSMASMSALAFEAGAVSSAERSRLSAAAASR